ncbi:hypothetical protein EOM60_06070 [Candidatus Saccharibacteria bacterium]|nr:hypothetical protein [Candidatus Saccharibacteria bacterium]
MLTAEQIEYEVSQSKRDLASHGINANSFASPYGDYSMYTLQVIEKYYTSHRAFRDTNNNVYPYNDLLLNNMQVQYPVTLAAVKAKVDDAIAHNYWLVLTFHDIRNKPSKSLYNYQWGTADFNALASYVKLKQDEGKLKNTTVSQGLVSGTRNLLPVAVVNNRLSNGWSTDRPLSFTPSTSLTVAKYVSESATSLRATGGVTAGHLFSPKTAVTHGSSYVIKSFLNVQSITKGEVGYYIDEYDASGNWVSGQFKTMEPSVYTEKINFAYQPSSQIVKSASLQIYITNGSDVQASVDDFEWFVVDEATSPIVATNLMPNGSFETGLNNGWWTDDTTAIQLDQAGNGSDSSPSNSVAFSKTTGTAHLFSPILSIVANQRYYFEHYLNIVAKTEGEVGVYIDEFDSNGNWISGQYKITSTTLGKQTVQYAYTPSSSSVTSISEQFIVHAPGSISGYIDDIRLSTL